MLIIPQVLGDNLSPGYRIIPDSELIFSGAAWVRPRQVAAEHAVPGPYQGFAENIRAQAAM